MRTDDLIQRLAADLPEGPARPAMSAIGLGPVAGIALALTVPLCLWLHGLRIGARPEEALGLLFWAGVALAAVMAGRRLMRPEPAPILLLSWPLVALGSAAVVMASLGLGEGVTVFRADHVAHCAEIIGALALAPFLALSWTMRRGAPVAPRMAGAMIGLVAGAIAALAYTLSCPIDDALAALSAHAAAVLLVSAAGALIGPGLFGW